MSAYAWLYPLMWDGDTPEVSAAIWALNEAAQEADFDSVEANYPVLVQHAREAGMPWLELFARHMRHQAYVNSGHKVGEHLPDIVRTLALTAEAPYRDSPQAVCTIQDLSLCYAAIDAPSYALDRLSAVDDVLPGLSPHIECATCLLDEKMDALSSLGRYDEALATGEAFVDRARAAGVSWENIVESNDTKLRSWITAALGAGDLVRARRWLDMMEPGSEPSHVWKAIRSAQLALAEGSPTEAASLMPAFDTLGRGMTDLRRAWLRTAHDLTRAGALVNDAELNALAVGVARESELDGRLRDAFDSFADAANLAVLRGDLVQATACLADARRMRDQLRASHGADERLADLSGRIPA